MIYGYLGTMRVLLDRGAAAQALLAEELHELGHHPRVFGKS